MDKRYIRNKLYTIFYKGEYIRHRYQNQDPYMHSVAVDGLENVYAKINELREKGYPIVRVVDWCGKNVVMPA